jgi:S1-C subfamily serine protease
VDRRFSEGDWSSARVVGSDVYTDLAVGRADVLPPYATPLAVAGENPIPGEPAAALGNPMGLDGTLTTGVVSGVNRSMATSSASTGR